MDASTGFSKYIAELQLCYKAIIAMASATLLISAIYIFILKWLTKPLLYVSMVAILVAFVLLGGWCWLKKAEYNIETQKKNYDYCLAGAITAWVVAALYMLFICCLWKSISLGASIMEAASEFVTSNLRILVLPVVAYLVCVPYIAYWSVTAVYIYSLGEPEFKPNSFFANIKWGDETRYAFWYFVFALCWCVSFFICLQQFMIAATVCQWYFTG